MRYANRLREMRKSDLAIYFVFGTLVTVSVFSGNTKMQWVNDAILAITAVIVLWYTRETAEMKKEVAKQNLLQTRPILILELNKPKLLLKNEGKGPALNCMVAKFKVRLLEKDRLKETKSDYEFNPFPFVPADKSVELLITRADIESGNKGTVPESDVFFQLGCTVYITMRYEDIEGTKYQTDMEVRSGFPQNISFHRC
jgi:hypothetical protein